MLKRWVYRSRQFFAAWGRISREDMAEARQALGPELYPIFAAMPSQYRLHSLNVYKRVQQAGCNNLLLWQAALLHDSGKFDSVSGRYVTIVHRVLVVLLSATPTSRRLLKRLSRPVRANRGRLSLDYWRYPFYLSERHAELGAQLAAERGGSHELVELIKKHHIYQDQSPELKALQASDDRS
ncbi:MAG: hypothetical protein ABIO92_10490 [Chloroflexia bacterium]